MSDHEQSERDRAALFVEYYGAVSDITDAFESRWSDFANEWHDRVRKQIDDSSFTEEWVFWEYDDDLGFLYENGWWRRVDTFEPISEPMDPNRVRVGFLHRLHQNIDFALREHTLEFLFRNRPPNRHEQQGERNVRAVFIKNFESRESEIRAASPERASLTANMHNMIEASYDTPVADFESFEEAYLSALQTAFEDHVVENAELVG